MILIKLYRFKIFILFKSFSLNVKCVISGDGGWRYADIFPDNLDKG